MKENKRKKLNSGKTKKEKSSKFRFKKLISI